MRATHQVMVDNSVQAAKQRTIFVYRATFSLKKWAIKTGRLRVFFVLAKKLILRRRHRDRAARMVTKTLALDLRHLIPKLFQLAPIARLSLRLTFHVPDSAE